MKLFVIGNGFDVSHGIPSKYSNFYNYLRFNRQDILIAMERFYCVENDSDLWSDFENSLERDINYDALSEIIGENVPNFASDEFRDGDWYDAQIYIEQDCDDLLRNIRAGFEEWIRSLDIMQIVKKLKIDSSAIYMTFNYTTVLEQVYRIPTSNICYIHNKVGEELVFGHGKGLEDFNVKKALYGDKNAHLSVDEDGNIESSEVGHERIAENAVCVFYDKMRKNTEKTIQNHFNFFNNLSGVDEVIVLGHSYNVVDFPYFEKISESINKNAKWVLSYFSETDKQSAEKVMDRIKIPDDLREYKHCKEFETEDT
jgi:hypothetical protein